jgi:hypothetical protein
MRKKNADVVSVELRGGLGNQLFGLSVGWLISSRLQWGLNLDGRYLRWQGSNSNRSLELDKFNFNVNENISFNKSFPGLARLNLLRKWILRLDHAWRKVRDISSVNCDWHNLLEIEKAARKTGKIQGSFMDFRWASEAQKYGFPKRLELKTTSARVYNLLDQVSETCAVHIRLTDFLDYPGVFPKLSNLYFESAILEMSKSGISKFTVFTDDLELARDLYPSVFQGKDISIIPNSLSTTETFFLMQSCAGIISASSSFSSWAAFFIANQGGPVICPNMLLLDGSPDPRPTAWLRLDYASGSKDIE